MDTIISYIMSFLNSPAVNQTIDDGLAVANQLPEGVGNGAALLAFFFIMFIVVIFGMALKGRTGEW